MVQILIHKKYHYVKRSFLSYAVVSMSQTWRPCWGVWRFRTSASLSCDRKFSQQCFLSRFTTPRYAALTSGQRWASVTSHCEVCTLPSTSPSLSRGALLIKQQQDFSTRMRVINEQTALLSLTCLCRGIFLEWLSSAAAVHGFDCDNSTPEDWVTEQSVWWGCSCTLRGESWQPEP